MNPNPRLILGAIRTYWHSSTLFKPFLIAVSAVAAATLARMVADPLVHNKGPLLFFAVAVVVAALYGGARAGILATILSVPVSDYFFIAPRHTWFIYDAPGDSLQLALFATLGAIITVIIHRFKTNQRRLTESQLALKLSESNVAMIAAAVPEILFTMTAGGASDYFNSRLCEYTGRKLEALVGQGWVETIHPEDRDPLLAAWFNCVQAECEFETTIRLRRWDGEYRWFKCHAAPVRDPGGQVAKWFGVCSDVHDQKTLEDTLEKRNKELLLLNAGLERFAYTASHDLQEPLRTIGTTVQLFLHRYQAGLDAVSRELLDTVVASARRMRSLVDDILAFSRIGHQPAQELTPVDANVAVQNALANLHEVIRSAGATVTVEPLPEVSASNERLLRVFQNLVGNAIKFRGKEPPAIRISGSENEAEFVFAVQDNGIGMEPQYHDQIFESFRRLHGRSEYEGSGIGLSICKRIVESYKGRIWVESRPGSGSTFYFTIPKTDLLRRPNQSEPGSDQTRAAAT